MTRTLALCAVCLLVGFAIGRYTTTPSVEESTQLAESATEQQQTVTHTEAVVEARQETEEATERVRYVRIVEYRDGPIASTREETETTAQAAKTATETKQETAQIQVVEVERVREVEVQHFISPVLPRWRVAGTVGLDLDRLTPTYGAALDYRLFGPFHVRGGVTVGASVTPSLGLAFEF